MGSAGSIENAQYDADKFKQSKEIMESGADDAEKFAKLKAIWGSAEVAAAVHKGSTKDLHAVNASSDTHPSAGPSASETKAVEHHEHKAESHDAKKEDAKPTEAKKEEPKPAEVKKDDAKPAEHHEPKKEDGKPAADGHSHGEGHKGEDPKKHEEHAHAGESHAHAGEHHAEKAAH